MLVSIRVYLSRHITLRRRYILLSVDLAFSIMHTFDADIFLSAPILLLLSQFDARSRATAIEYTSLLRGSFADTPRLFDSNTKLR